MMAAAPDGDGAPLDATLLERRREDLVRHPAEHDRAADGHHGEQRGADDRERERTALRAHGQPQQPHAAAHDLVVAIAPCHGGRTYRRARRTHQRQQTKEIGGSGQVEDHPGRGAVGAGRGVEKRCISGDRHLEAGERPVVRPHLGGADVGLPAELGRASARMGLALDVEPCLARGRAGRAVVDAGAASRPLRRGAASGSWRGGTGPGPAAAPSLLSAPTMRSRSSQPVATSAGGRPAPPARRCAGRVKRSKAARVATGGRTPTCCSMRRHAQVMAVGQRVDVRVGERERAGRHTRAPPRGR